MEAVTPPFIHRFSAMTTACELLFYSPCTQQLAQHIEQEVRRLEQRYNFHSPDSWLSRALNARPQSAVRLDGEALQVLSRVSALSQATAGAFDITVGTLSAALAAARSLADVAQIKRQYADAMGPASWRIEGDYLHCNHPDTRFDLGGVIKEYAVDVAVRLARAAGVSSGLINFGGDLYALGLKPNGERFVAAVPDPAQLSQPLFALDLEDQALTTSAHYARSRPLKDGQLSHLVLSCPDAPQALQSASVVSASALLSGMYSTALLLNAELSLPAGVFAITVDGSGQIRSRSQT